MENQENLDPLESTLDKEDEKQGLKGQLFFKKLFHNLHFFFKKNLNQNPNH
jgi:hypothetical protein